MLLSRKTLCGHISECGHLWTGMYNTQMYNAERYSCVRGLFPWDLPIMVGTSSWPFRGRERKKKRKKRRWKSSTRSQLEKGCLNTDSEWCGCILYRQMNILYNILYRQCSFRAQKKEPYKKRSQFCCKSSRRMLSNAFC